MSGWKRNMQFEQCGLPWVPTSPHIPEPTTPFYCATTGPIGELPLVNIGVGYTAPFRYVGAPWIRADQFSRFLNKQNLPGVFFLPTHYTPRYALYANTACEGVFIVITDPKVYKPCAVQSLLLGALRALYPKEFLQNVSKASQQQRAMFAKATGKQFLLENFENNRVSIWGLIAELRAPHVQFMERRKKSLLPEYEI